MTFATSVSGIIVLLKTNREILLDLADFALQEQPGDHLMGLLSYKSNRGDS